MNRKPDNGDRLFACSDCGDDFLLEAAEIRWYEGKGLQLPKRCQPCRKAKRERNEQKAS
jgi:putative zinc ribbon protein